MRRSYWLVAVLALSMTGTLLAQHAPDGHGHDSMAVLTASTIPNEPYTGRADVSWVRTLGDGTTVTHRLYVEVARDGQGRELHKQFVLPAAAAKDQRPVLNHISIYDPVSHLQTRCYTANMLCEIHTYRLERGPVKPVEEQAGVAPDGLHSMTRDQLGEQSMQGVRVVGSRENYRTEAGAAGNDRPLVRTKTYWYSPELQLNMQTVRTDPKEGTQTITFIELNRNEPAPKVFVVPAGFRTVTSSAAQTEIAKAQHP